MTVKQNRRKFLQIAGLGAISSLIGSGELKAQSSSPDQGGGKAKFKIGLASYTLREFTLDQTLAMTKRVGLKHVAFKSFHLALDSTPEQIAVAVKKVNDAGLNLYGGGVINMKLEKDVHNAFAYAKMAGMKVIIGAPAAELLLLVDKKVKEYDIAVAIHNHGPGDDVYPLPSTIYEKVKGLDERIGICIDVGHTQRMGVDPSKSIVKYQDRILDVHIKDVSAADESGTTVEIGRGVIDIPRLLKTLIDIDYTGMVAIEYEKDKDDPLPGLAESVGYIRGVLAMI
ncbi:MAG: sugar phosphate isomerase/epimerase family protein [Planctomycetota bacterium]|jgi:sugar phosphate isomerase/epimerase